MSKILMQCYHYEMSHEEKAVEAKSLMQLFLSIGSYIGYILRQLFSNQASEYIG